MLLTQDSDRDDDSNIHVPAACAGPLPLPLPLRAGEPPAAFCAETAKALSKSTSSWDCFPVGCCGLAVLLRAAVRGRCFGDATFTSQRCLCHVQFFCPGNEAALQMSHT